MVRVVCALASVILGLGWASASLAVPVLTVVSITPISSGPSASSESFTVTFSEAVSGVDTSDFHPTTTGSVTGNVLAVSGSGSVYTVTVGGVTGVGTLRLDLNAAGTGIMTGGADPIAGGYTSGGVRTITAAAVPAPVPTLSEWAMILFGVLVAGGGALYLQQRRLAA